MCVSVSPNEGATLPVSDIAFVATRTSEVGMGFVLSVSEKKVWPVSFGEEGVAFVPVSLSEPDMATVSVTSLYAFQSQ